MRIFHVTDCFLPMLGGIESQVSRLAEKQVQAGHQVTVLTCAADQSGRDREFPFRVIRSVMSNPFGAPVDVRAPGRFSRLIAQERPDVVHLHMGELTPVVQALLMKLASTRQPVTVSVHSVWSKFPTIPLYRQIAKSKGLTRAEIAWTGVSELVANLIRQVIPAQFVRVLPNGIETANWVRPPAVPPAAVHPSAVRPSRGLHVVSATRFAPRKRVGALVKIIAQAREIASRELAELGTGKGTANRVDTGVPLRVTLAGEGPLLEKVRRSSPDWINFPGRLTQPQLADLYATADVFVAPGVKDSFSIAGVEARAAGLALLTRAESGLGQDLMDGTEGRRATSDEALSQILAGWIVNPSEVEAIKAHNRQAGSRFDWSEVLPQTEAIYRWATELRKTAP